MALVPHLGAALCAGLLGLVASACCVAPPRSSDWLAVGFRSPEQAIRTFQTAVRADSAELEYRCFSAGFRSRNGISQLTWAEVREELRKRHPWLRKGLTDAEIVGPVRIFGDRAVALLVTHGREIQVELAREDFAELWSGTERVVDDEDASFARQTVRHTDKEGRPWFSGSVRVPEEGVPPQGLTEIHVGREWKIDSFESAEAPRESPLARAPADPEKAR